MEGDSYLKSIVIYYSQTGNTKAIAEAIYQGMKQVDKDNRIAPLKDVDVQELIDFDLVGIGSPVFGFQEPPFITDFINTWPSLKGKYGFSFCTHGTLAGAFIARTVVALREKGLTVTGWNDWYGGAFIPTIPKPYFTDGHPDSIDLQEAKDFGREMVERSMKIAAGGTQLIPELPEKEEYDTLYGVPPILPTDTEISHEERAQLKPRLNTNKCNYPKCTICMDNCPTSSIDLSKSPQINHEACGPCALMHCEQLCPTGAIEIDWSVVDNAAEYTKAFYGRLAKGLKMYKDLRHFRPLISEEEECNGEPLYKINQHPRFVMRDGVMILRRKP
jgi:flavodoxin/ferredoxin